MQTEEQREAEAKFWATPDLVEKLFSTLDLDSTLSLALVMNKEILKRGMTPMVWSGLVRESFLISLSDDLDLDDTLDVARNLASILKIMKMPKALLLDALHVICETDPWDSTDQLELICPNHSEPHSVSGLGFILLEEMEAALGTTEQSIRSVVGVYSMCSFLGVLILKIYLFQCFQINIYQVNRA